MKKSRIVNRRELNYVDEIKATAVCPFFENATLYSLVCKSPVKGALNYTKFINKDAMEDYANNFCCSIHTMNKCPHNKLLTLYYNISQARKTAQKAEGILRRIQNKK